MEKQTAVDWLDEKLIELDVEFQTDLITSKETYWIKRKEIIEQAKQMFKGQIIKTHLDCWGTNKLSAEDYYNKTYVEDKTFKRRSLWTKVDNKQQ